MICTRQFFITSTIYMDSTEHAGEAGQFYFQTAQKKKTFQVIFTLTDTVQEVHERQARHSIKAQKIPRSSDETCMIKDLLQPYKLSSFIWWVRCCHRGTTLSVKSSQKKEKKLHITFSATQPFSMQANIKALPFSAFLPSSVLTPLLWNNAWD